MKWMAFSGGSDAARGRLDLLVDGLGLVAFFERVFLWLEAICGLGICWKEIFVKFGKIGNDCGLMVVWIDEFVMGMWFDDG